VWALDWWQDRERSLHNLHAALKHCEEQGPLIRPELPELMPPVANAPVAAREPEPQKPKEEQAPLTGEPYTSYCPVAPLPPLFEMTDTGLRHLLLDLLKEEAPIKLSYVYTRMRAVTPTPAISPNIKNRIQSALEKLEKSGRIMTRAEGEDAVLFLASHPEPCPRTCGPRAWSDVPHDELLLIADLVHAHLKCLAGTDAHLRGIATYLGISRLSTQFKQHLTALIRLRKA
jgi:hypothetical protein